MSKESKTQHWVIDEEAWPIKRGAGIFKLQEAKRMTPRSQNSSEDSNECRQCRSNPVSTKIRGQFHRGIVWKGGASGKCPGGGKKGDLAGVERVNSRDQGKGDLYSVQGHLRYRLDAHGRNCRYMGGGEKGKESNREKSPHGR